MRGLLAAMLIATGCTQGVQKEQAVTAACVAPESVADYVHMVIEADRATYSDRVVHRLQNVEKVINASESFEEDHALPLPSQMLRMGAARSAESSGGRLRYALISEWAINKANLPKTDFEKRGLRSLAAHAGEPYRGYQSAGEQRYFTALYADRAVSQACVDCHNQHPESPRGDFKLGEVMGGVVVTMKVD